MNGRVELVNGRYALTPNPVSGGMADVYRAADMMEGARTVAVKMFRRGELEDEILREAFSREVRALRELKHRAIVEMLDSGVDGVTGRFFLVLEWLPTSLEIVRQRRFDQGWDSFYE